MLTAVANGKVCYLEIPALDPEQSSQFYHKVFGWQLRRESEDCICFDDTTGEVSGMWERGRPPASTPGIIISIMVLNAEQTIGLILANGGEIVKPLNPAATELTAWFRDPGGNVLGIYQEPSQG